MGYLDTSDQQTIDYNNDADITDLETVDYNNNTNISDLKDNHSIDMTNLKKTSKAQIAAKKITRKYRKISKSSLNKYKKIINTEKDDAVFIKQVPVHPSIRFKKLNDLLYKVEFIKQAPVHPRNRLKKLSKKTEATLLILHLRNRLPNDKLLKHPRNKFAAKEAQIARNNVSGLMRGEFNFSFKNILNKTLIFDTSKKK